MLTMMIFEVATIEIMMMILSYEVIIFEVKIYKMMMMQCLCVCHGKSSLPTSELSAGGAK